MEENKSVTIKAGNFFIEISSRVLFIKDFFNKRIGVLYKDHFYRGGNNGNAGDIIYRMETMPWYSDSIGEAVLEAIEDYWGVK